MTSQPLAPAPLFRDPVTDGAADPTVVAGPDGRWWMFYTQQRPADPGPGARWVHGSRIGVANSLAESLQDRVVSIRAARQEVAAGSHEHERGRQKRAIPVLERVAV